MGTPMHILHFTMITVLLACPVAAAIADEDGFVIPQVTRKPAAGAKKNAEKTLPDDDQENDILTKDHQAEILSNPNISEFGRVNAMTGVNGSNKAVISQQGGDNRSTVIQTGKDNEAIQIQHGNHNDMLLNQQGIHNRSEESQVGDYNHKIKIQNNRREEEIIESPDK